MDAFYRTATSNARYQSPAGKIDSIVTLAEMRKEKRERSQFTGSKVPNLFGVWWRP